MGVSNEPVELESRSAHRVDAGACLDVAGLAVVLLGVVREEARVVAFGAFAARSLVVLFYNTLETCDQSSSITHFSNCFYLHDLSPVFPPLSLGA